MDHIFATVLQDGTGLGQLVLTEMNVWQKQHVDQMKFAKIRLVNIFKFYKQGTNQYTVFRLFSILFICLAITIILKVLMNVYVWMDFKDIPKINAASISMSATPNHLKGFAMIHMNAQILLAPINAFAQLVLFKLRILNVFLNAFSVVQC